MTKNSILVVEDDASLREALEDALVNSGFDVATAEDGSKALLLMQRIRVDLVISDVQMSPVDGWELLQSIRTHHPGVPVVLMTAFGSIDQAVQAMRFGAVDYLAKPFEVDALLDMVRRFLPATKEQEFIAVDPRSIEVVALAQRLADNDLTVMISGESGTGKEVFARYIHACSSRSEGPFVAINCAAIPEHMLEAVLFGYEKGAFTGAHKAHVGKFEQAQGGTLLLDEISEMGQALQTKLLRVLQEREVERLGSTKTIALDVRVFATTNRDLRAAVDEGKFREDLFYRINVLPLVLPPLRQRPADIMPLVTSILRRQCVGSTPVTGVSNSAEKRLLAHSWPGNVRELENLIQRAMVLATSETLDVQDLAFETDRAEVAMVELTPPSLDEDLREREREIIFAALKSDGGSRQAAASRLGISQRTLRHKLARLREEGATIPGEMARYEGVQL